MGTSFMRRRYPLEEVGCACVLPGNEYFTSSKGSDLSQSLSTTDTFFSRRYIACKTHRYPLLLAPGVMSERCRSSGKHDIYTKRKDAHAGQPNESEEEERKNTMMTDQQTRNGVEEAVRRYVC